MRTRLSPGGLRWLNWAGWVVAFGVTALAVFAPGGLQERQFLDCFPSLLAPMGFTWGIWGVLLLGHLLFCLFQSGLLGYRRTDDTLIADMGVGPALAGALYALHLLAWLGLRPITALGLTAALLLALIALYRGAGESAHLRAMLFAQAPFRLYLGWVSFQAIATAAAALVHVGFDGWGLPEEIWAALMVAFSTVLGVAMLLRHRGYAFALAIAWALLGVFLRHTLELDGHYQPVILATVLGMIVLPGGMAYTYFAGKNWGRG